LLLRFGGNKAEKIMKAVHGYLAVAILASFGSVATAQETLHASKLIGARVQNAQGEDLGEVEDLLVGADDDKVTAAVISVGGVLDVGDRLVTIPFRELLIADDKVQLQMTQAQLATAPEFTGAGDATLATPRSSERGTPGQGSVAPPPTAAPDERAVAEAEEEAREVFAEDDPRVVSGIADNKEAFDGDEPARGHSAHDQTADDQAVENEPHEGGDDVPHEP
jgi:sporulation protein YlmC with PRC-barrel domain